MSPARIAAALVLVALLVLGGLSGARAGDMEPGPPRPCPPACPPAPAPTQPPPVLPHLRPRPPQVWLPLVVR